MKISCYVTGNAKNRNDQWMTSRGEGRAVINWGFGFGKIGQEVDIICEDFVDSDNVIPGVNLRKRSDYNKMYDLAITYNAPLNYSNYKKLLFFPEVSNSRERLMEIKNRNPGILFMAPSRRVYNLLQNCDPWWKETFKFGDDLKWLSGIYPITCLPGLVEQDFLPFKFDPSKKNIRVWCYIDGWPDYYLPGDEVMLHILRILKNKYGFKIDLHLHLYDTKVYKSSVKRMIDEFNPNLITNYSLNYLEVLNMLSSMDICMTKGSPYHCGMCSYDIVSLGKPMMYCVSGDLSPIHLINDIYAIRDYTIRAESTPAYAEIMVNKFMSNPQAFYGAMKNAFNDSRFPVWSKIATDLINSIKL